MESTGRIKGRMKRSRASCEGGRCRRGPTDLGEGGLDGAVGCQDEPEEGNTMSMIH
jgi:hypothetical protein